MKENGYFQDALIRILRPLARMLLRNGVSYKAFAELSKRVFVEVAREEFRIPGRKQSDSRVSVITGLSRKEVKRVRLEGGAADENLLRLHNRASRVIYGWLQDQGFLDAQGRPRPLPVEEDRSPNFVELVRRYSGDAPPRAVMDELERLRAVERRDDGYLALTARNHADLVREPRDKLVFLGQSLEAVLRSVDQHWNGDGAEHFHGLVAEEVARDGQAVQRLRTFAREQAPAILEPVRNELRESPSGSGETCRAGTVLVTFEY